MICTNCQLGADPRTCYAASVDAKPCRYLNNVTHRLRYEAEGDLRKRFGVPDTCQCGAEVAVVAIDDDDYDLSHGHGGSINVLARCSSGHEGTYGWNVSSSAPLWRKRNQIWRGNT